MAPRTTFATPQNGASHVVGGKAATPICHTKRSQKAILTPQKTQRILREMLVNAVKAGNLVHVRQLVQHMVPDFGRGHSLLHVAAENNHPHVTAFLLRFVSPNSVNLNGYTPAHLAAMKGHTQVLGKLFNDPHFDASKRDPTGKTYTHWLCVPLYEAVLKWDKVKIQNLLSVGADPDMKAKEVVGGALARELRVNTARQLAQALGRQQIVTMFEKPRASRASCTPDPERTSQTLGTPLHQLPMGTMRLHMAAPVTVVQGPDVYNRTDVASPGYVCLLNYNSFMGRLDLELEGAEANINNLATVFSRMGYTGHAHRSLTADQTRHELAKLRDMEEVRQAGCLVVVVSSHGTPHQQFLTSDMELLNIQWVLDHFKDSQCPHLKDKPKLIIWDLCHGYYRDEQGRASNQSENARVDEPLRDVLCLSSSSGGFTSYSFTRDGTPFVKTLCRTLARHANNKEFADLYFEFLSEYSRVAPDVVPRLTNIGLSKQFYLSASTCIL
ncbi:caspase-1-like [Eriocheir sinensis]|uniref:caspase-1-like n=1 Tax=Eriocheir sinensis TaxID=95602 RepID=UPI0021CA4EC0|nr:caspase-1-like [Eriocheir sinensis]